MFELSEDMTTSQKLLTPVLKLGVQSDSQAFLYLSHSKFYVIMGFDDTPTAPTKAYSDKGGKLWLIFGAPCLTLRPVVSRTVEALVRIMKAKEPTTIGGEKCG
mmetsp:Transcript_33075/g.50738  ORF Transcript_33075/g.50738 Transcript_33075/m.50738 type:complete len:103 (-) Transcript_33075:39-347(-)